MPIWCLKRQLDHINSCNLNWFLKGFLEINKLLILVSRKLGKGLRKFFVHLIIELLQSFSFHCLSIKFLTIKTWSEYQQLVLKWNTQSSIQTSRCSSLAPQLMLLLEWVISNFIEIHMAHMIAFVETRLLNVCWWVGLTENWEFEFVKETHLSLRA